MISKAQIKHIQSLQNKKNRLEEKLFIVEGTKIVSELIASNTYKIHSIYHTNSFDIHNKDLKKIAFEVTEKELIQISTLSNPNQVLALAHMNDEIKYKIDNNHCYLALDEIKDPGNMGTIIRTAEWFGINTIFCSTTCVEYTNPKVIMASMGSFLRVKLIYINLENFLIDNKDLPIMGASLQGEDLYKTSLTENGILIIGSESHGISKNIEKLITKSIKIPEFGKAESLNASIANAIIISEWKRQHYGRK